MNEAIIERHNAVVRPEDLVYCLGDACLGGGTSEALAANKALIERLNGNIIMLRGNHDTESRVTMYQQCKNVTEVGKWADVIKYKGYSFYLSHHPTLTANLDKSPYLKMHLINLCGHRHTNNRFEDMINGNVIYHVELDAHNNFPVEINQIIDDLKIFLANNDQKD